MDDGDHVSARNEHAWNTHTYLNEYIKFADAKAGMVMAVAGGLAVFIVQSKTFSTCASTTLLGHVASGCLALSFVFGLLVISPVLFSIDAFRHPWKALKQSCSATQAPKGLIFWNEILAHGTPTTFSASLGGALSQQLLDEVAKHNFMLSLILRRKYRWLNGAIYMMVIGMATMVIFLALHGWDFSLRGAESSTKA